MNEHVLTRESGIPENTKNTTTEVRTREEEVSTHSRD